MERSTVRRYVAVIGFVTAVFIAADLSMLSQSHLIISPANTVYLLKAVPFVAFFLVAARIVEIRRPKFPDGMQAFLVRVADAMKDLGIFLALFIPLSTASFLFMDLAASTARPLMDAQLAAFDQAVGFDWLRAVQLSNSFPAAAAAMVFCYAALSYQFPIAILMHSIGGRRERMLELVALVAISGLMTGLLMLAVPAAGAYSFHRPDHGSFSHFTAAGFSHLSMLAQLRGSKPFVFVITDTVGLTSFPSFHTALGIIIAYNLRRSILFLPVAGINAIMIISTIPEGGHYLADVMAGGVVALASIIAVRVLGDRRVAKVGKVAVSYQYRSNNQTRV